MNLGGIWKDSWTLNKWEPIIFQKYWYNSTSILLGFKVLPLAMIKATSSNSLKKMGSSNFFLKWPSRCCNNLQCERMSSRKYFCIYFMYNYLHFMGCETHFVSIFCKTTPQQETSWGTNARFILCAYGLVKHIVLTQQLKKLSLVTISLKQINMEMVYRK